MSGVEQQPQPPNAQAGQSVRPLEELLNPEIVAHLRRHDLLLPLLRRSLLATTVQHVTVPAEASARLLQQYWQNQQIQNDEDRRRHLRERALTPVDLRWQLELQPRIRAYASKHFGAKAEARFLQRKSQLDQVVYSLIRVQEQYLAREIYLQLLEGEQEFAELARRYAQGPERNTNGVVGPTPLSQAHPLLADRLRSGEPGQLFEPMAIANWWVVARLDHYNPAIYDEATAQRMAVELFQEWIDEQLTDRLTQMQAPSAQSPRP